RRPDQASARGLARGSGRSLSPNQRVLQEHLKNRSLAGATWAGRAGLAAQAATAAATELARLPFQPARFARNPHIEKRNGAYPARTTMSFLTPCTPAVLSTLPPRSCPRTKDSS